MNNKSQLMYSKLTPTSYIRIRRDLWVKLNCGAKNANIIRRWKAKY